MYTNFTKIIKDDNGEHVVCANYGTDMCFIHKGIVNDCLHCKMNQAILTQLHAFEEAFEEIIKMKGE